MVKYLDPASRVQDVAAVMRGGEQNNLPAPVAIAFFRPSRGAGDCLVAYEEAGEAAQAQRVMNGTEIEWTGDGNAAQAKHLIVENYDAGDTALEWGWDEVNPGRRGKLRQLQQSQGRDAGGRDLAPPQYGDRFAPRESLDVPGWIQEQWHPLLIHNLDPTSTCDQIFALASQAAAAEPVALKICPGTLDQYGQKRIVSFVAWESAQAAGRAREVLEGQTVEWRAPATRPERRLSVKHPLGEKDQWCWTDVTQGRVESVRALAERGVSMEPQATREPIGRPRVLESTAAVNDPVHPVVHRLTPLGNVPASIAATWFQVMIHGTDPSLSEAALRTLVAPPVLPSPIALKVRNSGCDDYGQHRVTVVAAYEDEGAVDRVLESLDGKPVRWTGVVVQPERALQVRTADPTEGTWRWAEVLEERQDEFRRLAAEGMRVEPPSSVRRSPTIRTLAAAPPREWDRNRLSSQAVAGWSTLIIFGLDPAFDRAQAVAFVRRPRPDGPVLPAPVAIKFSSSYNKMRGLANVVTLAAYAKPTDNRLARDELSSLGLVWASGERVFIKVKTANAWTGDTWTEGMRVSAEYGGGGGKAVANTGWQGGEERRSESEPAAQAPDDRLAPPPPSTPSNAPVPPTVVAGWTVLLVHGLDPALERDRAATLACLTRPRVADRPALPRPAAVRFVRGRVGVLVFVAYGTAAEATEARTGLQGKGVGWEDGRTGALGLMMAEQREGEVIWREKMLVREGTGAGRRGERRGEGGGGPVGSARVGEEGVASASGPALFANGSNAAALAPSRVWGSPSSK